MILLEPAAAPDLARRVRELREALASVPIVVYTPLTCAEIRQAIALVTSGVDEVMIEGADDIAETCRRLLSRAQAGRLVCVILDALAPLVPDGVLPIVRYCLEHTRDPATVESIAAGLGVHRKTLVNRLKAARLPAPSSLIGWCRLFCAAKLMEDPGRTVEQTAAALNFESATALRNMLRRYTDLRPSEVRQQGGLACLLQLFRNGLVPRSSPIPRRRAVTTAVA
jgi:AraC-like DNA-binding protein